MVEIHTIGESLEVNFDENTKEVFFVNCDDGTEIWLVDLEEIRKVAEVLNQILEENA